MNKPIKLKTSGQKMPKMDLREKEIGELIKFPLRFDDYGGQMIFDADENMVCQVRGWGRLQYRIEDGKKIHDPENGAMLQDFIGNWIADTLNRAAEKDVEIERLRVILTDESTLHTNIIRGTVSLSRQSALHIAGAGDYDELKKENKSLTALNGEQVRDLQVENERLKRENIELIVAAKSIIQKFDDANMMSKDCIMCRANKVLDFDLCAAFSEFKAAVEGE